MTQKPFHARLLANPKIVAIALTGLLLIIPSLAIAAPARGKSGALFRPRAGEGAPARSRGGATRGVCPQDMAASSLPLTLLISSNSNNSDDLRKALTVSEHPSFLVYVPQTSATEAEFTLATDVRDSEIMTGQKTQDTYSQTIKLNGKPGIINLTLPADQPGLVANTSYKWAFTLICNPDRSKDAVADGKIRRVILDADKQAQLQGTTDPIAKAAIYGEAGIWYDMVATLASAQSQSQTDRSLATNWVTLLKSETVNLGSVANAPFVN